jgi:hypothetical protein
MIYLVLSNFNRLIPTLLVVYSAKIAEYEFGINFGQAFYDYSGNGNYGVNGVSYAVDSYDAFLTDRGIYLPALSTACGVSLPSNDFVSKRLALPSTFSLISWVFIESSNQDYSE